MKVNGTAVVFYMKLLVGFYLVFPADESPTISLEPDFTGLILVGAEFIPRFFAAMLDVTFSRSHAPRQLFLGNCSCVALSPTLTSMDGGNAKELFGTILAM